MRSRGDGTGRAGPPWGAAALYAAAAAAALAGAVWRAPGFDEGKTLAFVALPWREALRFLAVNESSPPLYFLLARAAAWLPDPLTALRLFSWACYLGSLRLARGLSRRLAPSAPQWCWALACLSSFWLFAAGEARLYSVWLLLSLLQARLALDLLEDRPDWGRRAAAYAAATLAAVQTHYYALPLTALHGALLAWRWRGERRRLGAVGALHAAAALSLVPWTLPHLRAQVAIAADGSTTFLGAREAARSLGTMLFEPAYLSFLDESWVRAVGWGLAAMVAAAAWRAARARGARRTLGLPLFYLLGGAGLVWAGERALGRPVVNPRHFLPWSIFLYALAAEWTAGLSRPARAAARTALVAVALAGTAGALFAAGALDPDLGRWAAVLRASADAREPVVYLEPQYLLPMRELFLPERPQYVCPAGAAGRFDYSLLPRYRGELGWKALSRPGACLVVDPRRRLGGGPLARLPCRALVRRLGG